MSTARGSFIVEEQFSGFDFDIETKINEPIVTVTITDIHTGLRAKGAAKRNDPDKFDIYTGRTLALSRALQRFARRLEKHTKREVDLAT